MVVRTTSGDIRSYPVVETIHKENICHLVFAPLRSRDPTLASRAQNVAEKAVRCLQGAGVFGVEMFLLENGKRLTSESSIYLLICFKEKFLSTKLHPDLITQDIILSRLARLLSMRITCVLYSIYHWALQPLKCHQRLC